MQKKKRKKGSSFKGLIFVLVIFGIIGYYIYWTMTKSNLTVMVTVYKDWNTLPDAAISIDRKKAMTQLNGLATIDLRANIGDTLIVRAEYGDLLSFVSVLVDEDRLNTGYTNADVVFTSEPENPYMNILSQDIFFGENK